MTSSSGQAAIRAGWRPSVPASAASTRASRRMVSLELARRCLGGRRSTYSRPDRVKRSRMFWVPPGSRRGFSSGPAPSPRPSIQAVSASSGTSACQSWSPPGTTEPGWAASSRVLLKALLSRTRSKDYRSDEPGNARAMPYDLAAARETYATDGVVVLRQALNAKALGEALAAWEWSLANPGPGASRIRQATDATFYNDLFNPNCLPGYREMLEASPLPALIAELWGAPDVWFF